MDNVGACGKYLGEEKRCRHMIARVEICEGCRFYQRELLPQTQQQRGLQLAIELIKERFWGKAEPEVSQSGSERLGWQPRKTWQTKCQKST